MTTPLETAVRELVAAMPKCAEVNDRVRCTAPATRHVEFYNVWCCDEHAAGTTWDAVHPLPYAPALRRVQAMLDAPAPLAVTEVPGEIAEALERFRVSAVCEAGGATARVHVANVETLKRHREELDRAILAALNACATRRTGAA